MSGMIYTYTTPASKQASYANPSLGKVNTTLGDIDDDVSCMFKKRKKVYIETEKDGG